MMMLFTIFVVIVLLNMLIAMMAGTCNRRLTLNMSSQSVHPPRRACARSPSLQTLQECGRNVDVTSTQRRRTIGCNIDVTFDITSM